MSELPAQVVTLGESLMLFTSPPGTALMQWPGNIQGSFVGAESNVAIGLARLGHRVRWMSVLGEDLFAVHILKTLRGEKVDVGRVLQSGDGPTAVLFKNRRPGLEPEIFYYRSTSAMSRATVNTFQAESWRDAQIVYLTGITPALGAGCRELVHHIVDDASARGQQVWFDPNYRSKLWSREQARQTLGEMLEKIDVILTSVDEGALLTGENEPRMIANVLFDRGPATVVVKAGAIGSYCYVRENEAEYFAPAIQISKVIDPIGAGDAFAAGYCSAVLDGLDPQQALQRGNTLGAIVCQTNGDWEGLPTRKELFEINAHRIESKR